MSVAREEVNGTSDTAEVIQLDEFRTVGRARGVRKCLCCDQPISSRGLYYKQGHDARHAGEVARAILRAGTEADHSVYLNALPTQPLRDKALAIVGRALA